jgi:hypothetical protein
LCKKELKTTIYTITEVKHVGEQINKYIQRDGSPDGSFRLLVGDHHDHRSDILRNYSNHGDENSIVGLGYHPNPNLHPLDGLHP